MEFVDKIYIISLEKHSIRKEIITADLDSAGFDSSKIEWINAIDGNTIDIGKSIEDKKIDTTFKDPGGVLTKSIYGCAMSHNMVYKKFLELPDDKIALVLEDDASVTHTLLRLLLTKSFGYTTLMKEIDEVNWDVLLMGGQEQRIEISPSSKFTIKPAKKYPRTYAAHSYLITKTGAEKLLESNECIQFAADVNIYCSDVRLYCTPISYFTQKVGTFEKYTHTRLGKEFGLFLMVHDGNLALGEEIISSTTYGDFSFEETDNISLYRTTSLSMKLDVDSVNWDSFIAPNGDEVENWANIKLKNE